MRRRGVAPLQIFRSLDAGRNGWLGPRQAGTYRVEATLTPRGASSDTSSGCSDGMGFGTSAWLPRTGRSLSAPQIKTQLLPVPPLPG